MSLDGQAGSETSPVSRAEFRREAARLGRTQAATIALQDATAFLRNTYLVSAAALAQAMAGALSGDRASAESISQIRSGLQVASDQYERVIKISSELLSADDAESTESA